MRHLRLSAGIIVIGSILVGSRADAAVCVEQPGGRAFVAAAKAAVDRQCPCTAATSPGAYLTCGKKAVKAALLGGVLPKQCASTVLSGVRDSTCGRPGAVVCCTTSASGTRVARLRNSPTECVASPGGSATVGLTASTLDACPVLPPCGSVPGFGEAAVDDAVTRAVATLESTGMAFDMANLAHRDVLFHQLPVELGCSLVVQPADDGGRPAPAPSSAPPSTVGAGR